MSEVTQERMWEDGPPTAEELGLSGCAKPISELTEQGKCPKCGGKVVIQGLMTNVCTVCAETFDFPTMMVSAFGEEAVQNAADIASAHAALDVALMKGTLSFDEVRQRLGLPVDTTPEA